MVDVLDEWNTDVLKQEVEQHEREADNVDPKSKKKKLTFCVTPSCFCFRKAREQRRNALVFQPNENDIQQVPKQQETSPFVDMSKLLIDGREDRVILIIPIIMMPMLTPVLIRKYWFVYPFYEIKIAEP
ncbi:hypothetical protein DVH24_020297 [Malus domestica]|uniref:Uncharacterized protein n=1 Tax=Malus domestica TaxID=3750 RepID=A0A498JAY7_MALDO|nr:hypothetical protein DVH24_020297 [Malus domestica]